MEAQQLIKELLIWVSSTRIDPNNSALYQAVDIDGKGIGLIATQDIKQSTIILSEQAILKELITNDTSHKYESLMNSFNLLNAKDKKEILSLSSCFNNNNKRNILIDIYYTNCIKLFNNSQYLSGLFPHIARINHSCNPNVFWIYESSRMIVRALFDIRRGEEITANYLIPFKYTYNERQTILYNKYKFKCKCDQCFLNVSDRLIMDNMIIKYNNLLEYRNLDNILTAINIINKYFEGYPTITMNLYGRCCDILMEEYDDNINDEICDKCLTFIQKSIDYGLKCYGDKSDWSETRKRIAILRWYSSDISRKKCNNLLDKWQHLFRK